MRIAAKSSVDAEDATFTKRIVALKLHGEVTCSVSLWVANVE